MFSAAIRLTVFLLISVSISPHSSFSHSVDGLLSVRNGVVHSKRYDRQLKAARVESKLGKRSIVQALRCDHELHYVDGEYSW